MPLLGLCSSEADVPSWDFPFSGAVLLSKACASAESDSLLAVNGANTAFCWDKSKSTSACRAP